MAERDPRRFDECLVVTPWRTSVSSTSSSLGDNVHVGRRYGIAVIIDNRVVSMLSCSFVGRGWNGLWFDAHAHAQHYAVMGTENREWEWRQNDHTLPPAQTPSRGWDTRGSFRVKA